MERSNCNVANLDITVKKKKKKIHSKMGEIHYSNTLLRTYNLSRNSVDSKNNQDKKVFKKINSKREFILKYN